MEDGGLNRSGLCNTRYRALHDRAGYINLIDRVGRGWIGKLPFDLRGKAADKIISIGMARRRGYSRGQSPWSMDGL